MVAVVVFLLVVVVVAAVGDGKTRGEEAAIRDALL